MNKIDDEILALFALEADDVKTGKQKKLCHLGTAEAMRDRYRVYLAFMEDFQEFFDAKAEIAEEFTVNIIVVSAIIDNKIYKLQKVYSSGIIV